jgi:hypothetical protein
MPSASVVPRRIGVYAPFTRSEVTWQALFLSIYLERKKSSKEKSSCLVSYVSSDIPLAGLSEAYHREVFVTNEMSDDAFKRWADSCNVIFWFTPDMARRKLCSDNINHYMFGDMSRWDCEAMRFTRKCTATIVPTISLRHKMRTLVGSRDLRVVYPDLGFPILPVRQLRTPDRLRVLFSLFGVKSLRYRLEVLQVLTRLLNARPDLHVTMLFDSYGSKEERQLIDELGFKYSGNLTFVTDLTDWQFFRILDRADVFVDLNPRPGNCFMLCSAVQRGVAAAAYAIEPNIDVLASGEIGYTIETDTRIDHFDSVIAVPNILNVFSELNKTLLNRDWLLWFKTRQNNSTVYNTELERRRLAFTNMWGSVNKKSSRAAPVAAFDEESID